MNLLTSLELWGALFGMAAAIIIAFIYRHWENHNRSILLLSEFLAVVSIAVLGDMIGWLAEGKSVVIALSATVCSYIASYLILVIYEDIIAFFANSNTENSMYKRLRWYPKLVRAVFVIETILILVSVVTGDAFSVFYYDASAVYHRGNNFMITQIPGILLVLGFIPFLVSAQKQVPQEIFLPLLSFPLLGVPGAILTVKTGLPLRNICFIISLFFIVIGFLYYNYRLRINNEIEIYRMEQEIVNLQIQPHFLYNVLNEIYYLCKKDPDLAQEAIADFSDYLRENLETIKSEHMVPFEKEIEHTEHYLRLEKLRYEERLDVIWNLEETDFSIPPLVLETIVENAVKHSVAKSRNGGSITITSKKTKDHGKEEMLISVEDRRFDTEGNSGMYGGEDKSTHIGIENAEKRLESLCGGTITMTKTEHGSVVEIRIPV